MKSVGHPLTAIFFITHCHRTTPIGSAIAFITRNLATVNNGDLVPDPRTRSRNDAMGRGIFQRLPQVSEHSIPRVNPRPSQAVMYAWLWFIHTDKFYSH